MLNFFAFWGWEGKKCCVIDCTKNVCFCHKQKNSCTWFEWSMLRWNANFCHKNLKNVAIKQRHLINLSKCVSRRVKCFSLSCNQSNLSMSWTITWLKINRQTVVPHHGSTSANWLMFSSRSYRRVSRQSASINYIFAFCASLIIFSLPSPPCACST